MRMSWLQFVSSRLQGGISIALVIIVVILLFVGMWNMWANRGKWLDFIKAYWMVPAIAAGAGLCVFFSDCLLEHKDCPRVVVSSCSSAGQFVLASIVGGLLALLCCSICVTSGKFMRLWLHRKVARMSYGFAILSCCVVITLPLVLSVPLLCLFECSRGSVTSAQSQSVYYHENNQAASASETARSQWKTTPVKSLIDKAVDGYFYAIHQGSGEKTLQLGENTISLFFGLIGYLIFSGFTVSMFVNMVGSKQRRIEQGEEHYNNLKNHYIVIGSGDLLEPVVKNIDSDPSAANNSSIVILSSESIPELRKRLSARLPEKCMNRLLFIHGDRTNEEDLRQLCVDSCKMIHLLGDFDTVDQDDRNMASLGKINAILRLNHKRSERKQGGESENNATETNFDTLKDALEKKPEVKDNARRKKCKIYLERYHTFTLFQGLIKDSKLDQLTLEPLCFYKHWAEIVLGIRKSRTGIMYPCFDGSGIQEKDSESFVHLVIIGMSRMGMTLATEAAMHMHFPNKKRTRITMIDVHAYREMCSFVNLHQNVFSNAHYTFMSCHDALDASKTVAGEVVPKVMSTKNAWLDVEFHFVEGNAESKSVRDLLVKHSQEKGVKLVIAVCLPDDRHSLSLALSLPDEILRQSARCIIDQDDKSGKRISTESRHPIVLVQQKRGDGLMTLLRSQSGFKNVYPFGMVDESIGSEADCDRQAKYQHLTYCEEQVIWTSAKLNRKFTNPVDLKKADEDWNIQPEWCVISNRYAVASHELKKRSFGECITCWKKVFSIVSADGDSLADLDALEPVARTEHYRWCMEKLMVGYQNMTDVDRAALDQLGVGEKEWRTRESALKKNFIHPAIMPWEKLVSGVYKKVYYTPTINTCIGICLINELEKKANGVKR